MSTYKHYLRGELVGEYPMPEVDPVSNEDWVDKNPRRPLCGQPWPTYDEDRKLRPLVSCPGPRASKLALLRILLRWNVMDRLRYWGLWPRRSSCSHYGRLPSGTIWGDLWRRPVLRPGG